MRSMLRCVMRSPPGSTPRSITSRAAATASRAARTCAPAIAGALCVVSPRAAAQRASCEHACIERLEVVATDAAIDHGPVAGSAWGGHQSRIVRTSAGDVYAVYVADSGTPNELDWRVAARGSNG